MKTKLENKKNTQIEKKQSNITLGATQKTNGKFLVN